MCTKGENSGVWGKVAKGARILPEPCPAAAATAPMPVPAWPCPALPFLFSAILVTGWKQARGEGPRVINKQEQPRGMEKGGLMPLTGSVALVKGLSLDGICPYYRLL